ncbi:MAG: hypothetical protein IKT91_02410, partial [Clostridia bacterium]|nr:hypothetical protein [Clostridia bacterium]
VSVTYTWVGEIPEESTEESTEASEDVNEEESAAGSEAESTTVAEETDSSIAIWLICIGVALVFGGCAAFFAKKKK